MTAGFETRDEGRALGRAGSGPGDMTGFSIAREDGSARAKPGVVARLATAAIAIGLVAAALWAIVALTLPEPPPTRAPFGMNPGETAPRGGALAAALLAVQGVFHQHLQAALTAMRDGASGVWTLIAVGFGYGVFHAAGPGHGKAVISAYLVADGKALRKGFALCLAAAVVQAVAAIAIVGVGAALFSATASGMTLASRRIEFASFAIVAALGLYLTWRKAGKVVFLVGGAGAGADAPGCDHVHMPGPADFERKSALRDQAGVVLAAGLRPCAGALVILAFALSQGMFWAGVAATFAMAAGTALTTGLIASLAVGAKALALRVAGGRSRLAALLGAGLELAAAAFVLVVGLALTTGMLGAGIF